MANTRREVVGYQPFRVQPQIADGLLPVARPGGELLQRTSEAFFRLAEEQGQRADRQAQRAGALAGQQAALAGGPNAEVAGGLDGGAAGGAGQSARGSRFAPDVNAAISRAAAEEGVDAGVLSRIAQIESGGNPRAKNPSSSAGGLFQQIDSNAKQYGVADRFDAYQSAKGAAKFMRDNRAFLRRTLGREPTAGELYLAHQQGPGGAAKLLRNPDALASSVVGARAVSQNGGTPGMTAGQFANLWTQRTGGGYAIPSSPDALGGGATGTASVNLSGGTWRPSGEDTIYGRAFDEAGSKIYLAKLDSEMRSTTSQLFDVYKDDPAALDKALVTLKGQLAKDHVFPEIMADYDIGFDNLAGAYREQARKLQIARQESQERAEVFERTGALKTDLYRQIAGLDPSSPAAANALANSLAALDGNYDAAVARNLMTPEAAAQAKADARQETAVNFYAKQADALDVAGVRNMRAKIDADFSAGKLPGIDGDGWLALDAKLKTIESNKLSTGNAARTQLAATGEDFAKRAQLGYDIDQQAYSNFILSGSASPESAAIVEETRKKVETARAIRDLPLPQGQAYVSELRRRLGDTPSKADLSVIEFAEKTIQTREKALREDPLGEAERLRLVQVAPIDASTPDALAASMSTRRQQAQQVAAHFGVPVGLYNPEEVKTIKADIKSIDPARYGDAMKQLDFIAGSGSLADVQRVFGDDGVSALQDWQARLRYESPEGVATWLKDRADPKWQERVQPLVSKGESEARKVSFEEIVGRLNENSVWSVDVPIDAETRRMLMNDFVLLSGERFVASQDKGRSQEQAVEAMKRHWGTTSVYGSRRGRLMFYPPEEQAAYPSIDGSKQWIADELTEWAGQRGLSVDNLSLVSDAKTKQEADSGRAPGYLVSRLDPATGLDELVTDASGRPIRHYFDPATAADKALKAAQETRRTRNDPWIVIDEGTSIGPFYPPWAPATDEDMRLRADRIRELLPAFSKEQKAMAVEQARPVGRDEALDRFLDGNPLTGRQ